MGLEEIKPWPRNPRINEEAVPWVAKSIQEHGYRDFIEVDEDGVILFNPHRL